MDWKKETLYIRTNGKGLYDITEEVQNRISNWGISEGLCCLFIPHTSASLIINESYDPTARIDIENFMERLAPENLNWYQHTLEGSDDAPSHMRAVITNPCLSIPIENNQLFLGTWQGVYVFEHRKRDHRRTVLIRCLKVN